MWFGPECTTCVSLHTRRQHAPNLDARSPGSQDSRRPRAPLHRPNGRGQPSPCACAQGPTINCEQTSCCHRSNSTGNSHARQGHPPPGKVLHRGVSMAFRTGKTMGTGLCTLTGMSTTSTPCTTRHRTPCEATGVSLWSNRQSGPWDKPLRHERELQDCKKGHQPPYPRVTGESP